MFIRWLLLVGFMLVGQAQASNIIRTPAPVYFKASAEVEVPDTKPSVSLSTQTLADAMKGKPYLFDFAPLAQWSGVKAGDAAPNLSWTAANALPEGLSLSQQGQLSGTPAMVGTTLFEVVATHADGEGRQLYTLKVGEAVFQARQIVAGGAHSCAILPDTTVKCWGHNAYGQMGDGSAVNRLTPVSVSGLSGVQQLTAGYQHTCAILSTGEVKCWGYNGMGQLGDGSTMHRYIPVSVSGLSGVQHLEAGGLHTCARLSTGGVQCWGYNGNGQLGDGSTTQRLTPVSVNGLNGVQQLAGGYYHTCAILSAGGVQCLSLIHI